jgi:O-antigen/teichoic acid export membrane protein
MIEATPVAATSGESPMSRFALFILPSLLQGGLSFALLPFTTSVLDPAEFAVFGLIGGFTALGSVFSSLGASYILAHRFQSSVPADRIRLVTTLMVLSIGASATFTILFVIAWGVLAPMWQISAEIPMAGPIMAATVVLISAPWVVSVELLTLTRAAHVFAIVSIAQSVAAACATLLGLFVYDLGVLSLFLGALAGSFVAGAGGIFVLRPYLGFTFNRGVCIENMRIAGPLLGSNGLDAVITVVERSLLSAFTGLHAFGIYFHSQQYLAVGSTAVKALFRTAWPLSLAEARSGDTAFATTKRLWAAAYFCIIMAGVGCAFFGDAIIGWLTHGKFSEAAPFVAVWMGLLLVQLSGRPQQAVLFGFGKGTSVVMSRLYATIVAALILSLIPLIGTAAAILSRFVQGLLVRLAFGFFSRKVRETPWQDTMPACGIGIIALSVAMTSVLDPSFVARVIAFFVIGLGLLLATLPTFRTPAVRAPDLVAR